MDQARARALLHAEEAQVRRLLSDIGIAAHDDRVAQQETGDSADPAQPLAAEGVDEAIAASLRERLHAIKRAEERLDKGLYGRSVRSGAPIPDERLEADPAAELTVEEIESRP